MLINQEHTTRKWIRPLRPRPDNGETKEEESFTSNQNKVPSFNHPRSPTKIPLYKRQEIGGNVQTIQSPPFLHCSNKAEKKVRKHKKNGNYFCLLFSLSHCVCVWWGRGTFILFFSLQAVGAKGLHRPLYRPPRRWVHVRRQSGLVPRTSDWVCGGTFIILMNYVFPLQPQLYPTKSIKMSCFTVAFLLDHQPFNHVRIACTYQLHTCTHQLPYPHAVPLFLPTSLRGNSC